MAIKPTNAFNSLLLGVKATDRLINITGSRNDISRDTTPPNSILTQNLVKPRSASSAVGETGKGSKVNLSI